jgi:lysophospholipase L1-like esterase
MTSGMTASGRSYFPTRSFLALGDSYTIGEGVPLNESFPYQTVQWLRKADRSFFAPEIIARTGWTTDELSAAMTAATTLPEYTVVTLLIGVNNQYRGRPPDEYAQQFGSLLQEAVRLAGRSQNVYVLSIPDWSVTPFAKTHLPDSRGRTPESVAREIDQFNLVAAALAKKCSCRFLDITTHTRASGKLSDSSMFVSDGLHPSGSEYRFWARQLSEAILEEGGGNPQ